MKKTQIIDKLIIALIISLVLSIGLSVVSFATEDVLPSDGVTQGGEIEGAPEAEPETQEDTSNVNMFIETIKVLVGDKFMQTVGTVIDVVLLIFLALFKKNSTISLGDIIKNISLKDTNGKSYPIAVVVKQLAEQSELHSSEISDLKKEIGDKLSQILDDAANKNATHDQVNEALVVTKAFLEMMHTVYSHSKTISDPTKEQVELIYTTALRKIIALEEGEANDGKK